jgi:hypothetical protein
MTRHLPRKWLGVSIALVLWAYSAIAADRDGELLDAPRWGVLGAITGFHSVRHRKSGLEARLLEADGSASVAEDPVALYLVVTNNGTSDRVERIWRIPRGVVKVKGLVETPCGTDVRVEVDRISRDGLVTGTTPKILRLCFLSSTGTLQAQLKVAEVAP